MLGVVEYGIDAGERVVSIRIGIGVLGEKIVQALSSIAFPERLNPGPSVSLVLLVLRGADGLLQEKRVKLCEERRE